MKLTNSRELLTKLGYTIVEDVEPAVEPERVDIKFVDILPGLKNLGLDSIAYSKLYSHQYQAFKELVNGKNIILKSGTGSGKTEAWVIYFLLKAVENKNYKAIAVYPTLALSNDQVRRITAYAEAVGVKVLQLDAPRRDKYVREHGIPGLRRRIIESQLIITNPAFLLYEVKKYIVKPSTSILESILRKLNLIVIDELDFYGPRSLALLMAMIDLITYLSETKPQVVILTATLANPEVLGEFLKEKTGRDYVVIDGKPFHVENRLVIVLGKKLEDIWSKVKDLYSELLKRRDVDEDILNALRDFNEFKKNPYRVLSYLEALGYNVPRLGLDYAEIISKYLDDDGVTIVFTRSIARAEEVAKRIKNLNPGYSNRIAAHHHLVSKEQRELIEEQARSGKIKVIVSPRTLTQGIDIGLVVRIVHLGLPEDVREFIQREGRKGRRKHIPFTETIIIPSSRWDWDLLSKGIEALRKWLNLPLEKTIFNKDNMYIKLFTGIAKTISPYITGELDKGEEEVLRKIGVLKKDGINKKKLKWIWDRLGFYEFAPPYGIKRYIESKDGVKPLEPIGHCDLVERFQIGCIDYSSDSMVVRHRVVGKRRIVTAVYEKPLWEIKFWEDDALGEAYEEYIEVKRRWGEEPSLVKDLATGKIMTHVHCVVYPPRNGFGQLIKVPNRVVWIVSSEKPKIVSVGGKHVVTRDKKTIYVPSTVNGEYRDYTYGYIYEVDETLDTSLLRLGLAYIMIVLRRLYGIGFETIMYGVEKVGDKKFFELHEPEACNIINTLDWYEVKKKVLSYSPDDLDLILLNQVDELAYADFLSLNIDWGIVKEYAAKAIDYILRDREVQVELLDKLTSIPKPSRALRIAVVDAIIEEIDKGDVFSLPRLLVALTVFDGEENYTYIDMILAAPGVKPPEELRRIENIVDELVYYEDYKIIVPSKNIVYSLRKARLRKLPSIIEESSIELSSTIKGTWLESTPNDRIIDATVKIFDYPKPPRIEEIHKIISRIKDKGYNKLLESEVEALRKYIEVSARANYVKYLLATSSKNQ